MWHDRIDLHKLYNNLSDHTLLLIEHNNDTITFTMGITKGNKYLYINNRNAFDTEVSMVKAQVTYKYINKHLVCLDTFNVTNQQRKLTEMVDESIVVYKRNNLFSLWIWYIVFILLFIFVLYTQSIKREEVTTPDDNPLEIINTISKNEVVYTPGQYVLKVDKDQIIVSVNEIKAHSWVVNDGTVYFYFDNDYLDIMDYNGNLIFRCYDYDLQKLQE